MELGQRVTAPGRLFKQRDGPKRGWHKQSWKQKPVEGIYIGRRTYACGVVTWEADYGMVFHPQSYLSVGLIVTDTRHNPIPVLFDELQSVND